VKTVTRIALQVDRDVQCCFGQAPENWRWRSLPAHTPSSPKFTSSQPPFVFELSLTNPAFASAPLPLTAGLWDGPEWGEEQQQPPSYPQRIDIYPPSPLQPSGTQFVVSASISIKLSSNSPSSSNSTSSCLRPTCPRYPIYVRLSLRPSLIFPRLSPFSLAKLMPWALWRAVGPWLAREGSC